MARVVVALSGGVDSAVAAYLLKEQGHDVSGVFMKNWSPLDSQSLTDCPWEQDQSDAEAVCAHLGIEFRSVNFEREYRAEVVDYMVHEYEMGRTPNPDVACNRSIKFGSLLKVAEEMGAEYLATGHYARKIEGKLYKGLDTSKDQSYFLWQVSEAQLAKALFPVGELAKSRVREIALKAGLPVAKKPDSQGICFIGQLDLKTFLKGEIGMTQGETYLVSNSITQSMILSMNSEKELSDFLASEEVGSKLVGKHDGAAFSTRGERAGAIVDNRLLTAVRGDNTVPSTFVVYRDIASNRVYVCDSRKHPLLETQRFQVTELSEEAKQALLSTVDVYSEKALSCVMRYRETPIAVKSLSFDGEVLTVELDVPAWAVSLGQSAVLYMGDERISGGIVCRTF